MAGRQGSVTPAIGVPFDDGPAGFEKSDEVYREIEAGTHDGDLGRLEQAIRARVAFDRRPGRKAPPPEGVERLDLVSQVRVGFFGRHTSMLGEAVRNRKVIQRNAALDATLERLKANPPTLAVGDRVRVNPDAPLKQKWTVLLGRTATVTGKPTRGKVAIRFDDGQPLGPLTNPATTMHVWMLEPLTEVLDPATMKAVLAKWRETGAAKGGMTQVEAFDTWLRDQS